MSARNLGLTDILPKMTSDPGSPVEGQEWYRTDTHKLWTRNDLETIELVPVLRTVTTGTTSLAPGLVKICSITLGVATYQFEYFARFFTPSTASSTVKVTLEFSGSITSVDYDILVNKLTSFAGNSLGHNTTFAGTGVTVSTVSANYQAYIKGQVVVSGGGAMTCGLTAAVGTSTALAGCYGKAERV